MKKWVPILSLLTIWNLGAAQQIVIQPAAKASSVEQLAAEELTGYLQKCYPGTLFSVSGKGNAFDAVIRLGTPVSAPELLQYAGQDGLKGPESYVVTTAVIDGHKTGLILGADPQGVLYGVYGLLEKLGCGFFISFDSMPAASESPFNFDAWNLHAHPTTPIRMVFNWHNFLSGCSGWDLEEWNQWIVQAQKSGYNTVLVHAYGNNPMFSFTFNGKEKPVGYLTSSITGRDWSVNHVNDVRRLAGGFLFDKPVFGCQAALVPDDQRVQAVQRLMQQAFTTAKKRGMNVNVAVDFDVPSCNPSDLIMTLNEPDRFRIGGQWIARPDTPAGYEFYKAQAKAMVETYPQVTTIALWRRKDGHSGATWPMLKRSEMPPAWQAEYDAAIRKDPAIAQLYQSEPAFGMAKVGAAWRKALDELGRKEVQLAIGSWGFKWVPGCAKFFPEEVKLIALDYEVTHGGGEFRNRETMQGIHQCVQEGRFVPVIWAHHDDGQYIGAPLRVYARFGSDLKKWGAGGFGIIHWMTHPLDLYFASHSRQTWSPTADEDLEKTSQWMAHRCFGQANREIMGRYLQAWADNMPFFGRETSDFFIDRAMSKYGALDEVLAGCAARLATLGKADLSVMTEPQKSRHQYFVDYERFVSDTFRTQTTFEKAKARLAAGDIDGARKLIGDCDPEGLVARYAKMAQTVGISRGEEGLVVSMNTRWIPHYVRFRQQLGLEPVRFNYGPTSHDALAQSSGRFTFYVSADKALWQTFGARETEADVFSVEALDMKAPVTHRYAEVCRDGIQSSKPISVSLAPILSQGSRGGLKQEQLPVGDYKLTVFLMEPTANQAGERILKLKLPDHTPEEIDLFKSTGRRNRPLALEYPIRLTKPGNVTLQLIPVKGKALLCAVTLEPVIPAGPVGSSPAP